MTIYSSCASPDASHTLYSKPIEGEGLVQVCDSQTDEVLLTMTAAAADDLGFMLTINSENSRVRAP